MIPSLVFFCNNYCRNGCLKKTRSNASHVAGLTEQNMAVSSQNKDFERV